MPVTYYTTLNSLFLHFPVACINIFNFTFTGVVVGDKNFYSNTVQMVGPGRKAHFVYPQWNHNNSFLGSDWSNDPGMVFMAAQAITSESFGGMY